MPNRIIPRRSFTPNSVPLPATDISAAGELLINWADKVAYSKDSSGNLITVPLGGSAGGGSGLTWSSVPASATASGTAGQIAYDSSYFYICTAAGAWVRYATAVWPDPDATLFTTAAGITDSTQSSAINTLVGAMKTAGIWSKMVAVYPFVGGTASAHKWNLKDPRDLDAACRLVFSGSWTHASTGIAGDGSSAYADTKLNPATALSATSYAEMTYYRTNPSQPVTYPGQGARIDNTSPEQSFSSHFYSGDGNTYVDFGKRVVVSNSTYGSATGLYSISRTSDSLITVYRNGVSKATGTTTGNQLPSLNAYLGAMYYNGGGATGFNTREMAFYAISSGLTDSEMSALYAAVQAFQTTLGRNV